MKNYRKASLFSFKKSKTSRLYQQMENANSYREFQELALALDQLEGMEEWKQEKESPYYNYSLIEQQLEELKTGWMSKDYKQLIYRLREYLSRTTGNITNPKLYAFNHIGTKYLIEDYIDTICSILLDICAETIPDFSLNNKLQFFREIRQHFGRSAIMLSGGANFGFFHLGVVKALWEHNLLPTILSGSSVGSIMAASIGSRTDEELSEIFDSKNFDIRPWKINDFAELWNKKALMQIGRLEKCIRQSVGEYSFREAYEKTGRTLNISVSPVAKHQTTQLLNHLTSPHLLLWSASLASCSVPGLFPPVKLTSKSLVGECIPYNSSVDWLDGSLRSDLPLRELSQLYGMNYSIVSQTNPHVIPFLSERQQYSKTYKKVYSTVQFLGKSLLELTADAMPYGVLKQSANAFASVIDQKYYGDVNIIMPVKLHKYVKVLSNLTTEEAQQMIFEGERATWPKIVKIHHQTKIERTLDECIQWLKKQVFNSEKRR